MWLEDKKKFFHQALVSLLLVVIICLFIGISYQDTIVVVILSSIVIFLLKVSPVIQGKNNRVRNQKLIQDIKSIQKNMDPRNNLPNVKPDLDIVEKKNTPENKNGNLPYHLQNSDDHLIDADRYNLDDCTTDKSCIQNPDVNNLFPGFQVKKSKKKDNIIVENFANCPVPEELHDIKKPYNDSTILPYQNYTIGDQESLPESKYLKTHDVADLAFHSKIGFCEGGVCQDINSLESKEIKEVVNEINKMKRPHPFSANFPTIRATNDESRF